MKFMNHRYLSGLLAVGWTFTQPDKQAASIHRHPRDLLSTESRWVRIAQIRPNMAAPPSPDLQAIGGRHWTCGQTTLLYYRNTTDKPSWLRGSGWRLPSIQMSCESLCRIPKFYAYNSEVRGFRDIGYPGFRLIYNGRLVTTNRYTGLDW